MIKKKFWILLGFAFPIIANAQEVTTTSGGSMTNSSIQVNWSIGEIFTESISTNNSALTAGLNQPEIKISTLVENLKNRANISIYPNPTTQFVNIEHDKSVPLKAKISTINGRLISIKEFNEKKFQLDFSNFESGIYIIEIADSSEKSNTYKIVKQ